MEKIWTKERYEAYPDKNKPGRYKFDDKSVIVINNKTKTYYYLGKIHREDGPAVEYIDVGAVRIEWYSHGKRHRLDGPACTSFSTEEWFKNGKRHCLIGPAIVRAWENHIFNQWFIEGEEYSEEEWKKLSFAILNNLEAFL